MTRPSMPVAQCLLVQWQEKRESTGEGGEQDGMGNPDHGGYAVRNDGTGDVRSDERRSAYETGCDAQDSKPRDEEGRVTVPLHRDREPAGAPSLRRRTNTTASLILPGHCAFF